MSCELSDPPSSCGTNADALFRLNSDWASSGTRRNRGLYKKRQTIERRNTRYHKGTYGPLDPKQCPNCLDMYYRQGLHGRPNQFSTPYKKFKGVGIKVHDLNYALRKNASAF